MSDATKNMVGVATASGKVQVPVVYRRSGLAVTPKLVEGAMVCGSYVITHERSGTKINRTEFASPESATRALLAMLKVADWTKTQKALLRSRSLGAAVYEAIRKADEKGRKS